MRTRGIRLHFKMYSMKHLSNNVLLYVFASARQATSQQKTQNSNSMHQRMQAVYANAMHCLMICLTDQSCKPDIYHYTHKK